MSEWKNCEMCLEKFHLFFIFFFGGGGGNARQFYCLYFRTFHYFRALCRRSFVSPLTFQ